MRIKVSMKRETKIDSFLKIATFFITLLTLGVTVVNSCNTWYKEQLEYDKPDNLIVKRISYNDETETFESNNQISVQTEFIYSVISFENAYRYNEVRITPVLYIYLKDKNGDLEDSQFVYLDKLYIDCTTTSETSILAFMDFTYDGVSLDELYRSAARYYNSEFNNVYVDADIVYKIDYKYLNNRNEYQDGQVLLSRESNHINLLSKKKLLIDITLEELFDEGCEENNVLRLESITKLDLQGFDSSKTCIGDPNAERIEAINAECFEIIRDFQNKHGIIDYYEHRRDSSK